MLKLKRIFFLMPLLLLVLSSGVSVEAADSKGRTLTDLVGRRVSVPKDPRRLVALAPSITEIVFSLGRQDRLKGVTRFSDFPPEAEKFPKVGSYVHLDTERIVALQPDLCIGIKDGNPRTVVEHLDALGIPVFVVHPVDLETVILSIQAIGDLLGTGDRAKAIVTDMRNRIRKVLTRTSQMNHKPRVFFQIGVSPIVSVGSDTFIHQLITMAGGTNVAAGPNPYPRYSREQVISLAPDVIVISSMARATVFEKVKAQWMQWPAIPAVKRRTVFIAPTNVFDRPTPRLIQGLELLADYIHPQMTGQKP